MSIMLETVSHVPVTIALSAHWHTYPERFLWLAEHGFAAEYSPNPEAFNDLPNHVTLLLQAGVPVRYHGFFPRYEFGHQDPDIAKRALQIHIAALEAMRGRGEQIITFHVGLKPDVPLEPGRVIEYLSKLVEHARNFGITVCLENLRRGPTSHPDTLVEWAAQSGAMITLDVGHATSNQYVLTGELSALDFIDPVADRLVEVHLYEKETNRHHAPEDMTVLGPIVDRLLETECAWWTIELNEYEDVLNTKRLLLEYVKAR